MQSNSEGNRANKSVITNRWRSSLNLEHLREAYFTLDRNMAQDRWRQGGRGLGRHGDRDTDKADGRRDGHDDVGTTRT